MEEYIKKIVFRLQFLFYLIWGIPIVLVVVAELNLFPIGQLVGREQVIYLTETLLILGTAAAIPLSLKYFSKIVDKKIVNLSTLDALKKYQLWSILRLLTLEGVALAGFISYYLTMSNTGIFCALIALTATLFCIPSEKRLRRELYMEKENME